jgi:MYXO-CTERM domain-containing protein
MMLSYIEAGWSRRAALGVAMVVFAGCSVDATGSEKTAHGASAIIHGEADTDEHDSVVLLAILEGNVPGGACTGTMVAPNLVLTARHCVSETDHRGVLCRVDGTPYSGGEVGADYDPADLLVYTGRLAIQELGNEEYAAARGKRIFREDEPTLCDRDIAFVLLDRHVDVPVAPIRLSKGARSGESLTAVGWGLTEMGKLPSKRMKRDDVTVAAVGPLVLDEATRIGVGSSEFVVREAACSGDSGGPAFASTGAVVGVVSRGGNGRESTTNPAEGCIGEDVIGFYTHLANKSSLVQRAFAASGYRPREEGAEPGKTKGATCSEDEECSSNACIDGVCATRCDDNEQCSDLGEVCVKKRGIHICAEPPPPERPKKQTEPGASVAPGAPGTTTTTTTITKTGCSTAPGAGSSTALGLAVAGLALAAARRRQRTSV